MQRTQFPPLGISEGPDDLPTLDEFRAIKRERCRRKLAAHHTKLLAAAVFAAFGDASRPVLATQGITIDADGIVLSAGEDQVDDQFCEIVSAMQRVHGTGLFLPCDVKVDPEMGAVVVPHSHDSRGPADGGVAPVGHA